MHFAKWVLWILLSSTSFAIEILFWDRVILEEHLFKVLWHIQSHFSKVYNYILDMLDWTPMYHGLIKKRWKKKKTSHRKYLIFLDLNGGEKSIFVGKRRRKAGGVTDGWLPVGRAIVRGGGVGRGRGERRGGGGSPGIDSNHPEHQDPKIVYYHPIDSMRGIKPHRDIIDLAQKKG